MRVVHFPRNVFKESLRDFKGVGNVLQYQAGRTINKRSGKEVEMRGINTQKVCYLILKPVVALFENWMIEVE